MSPAGGFESLCRERHYENGHHRIDDCGVAMAADDAWVFVVGNLLATVIVVASKTIRDDVNR